jgi:hypothetical protein
VGGLASADHHSELSTVRNGYYWLAIAALVVAFILYAADKGERETPRITVGRVVTKMEDWDWISPPEELTMTRRERCARAILRYR